MTLSALMFWAALLLQINPSNLDPDSVIWGLNKWEYASELSCNKEIYLARSNNIIDQYNTKIKKKSDSNIIGFALTIISPCIIVIREDLDYDRTQTVILHEIGHCLGLGHYKKSDSIMNPIASEDSTIYLIDIQNLKDKSKFCS